MDLKQCGRTGLYLSAIGIGTLTWGRDTDGPEALDMLRRFVDAGGNLVECSASHGVGTAWRWRGAEAYAAPPKARG